MRESCPELTFLGMGPTAADETVSVVDVPHMCQGASGNVMYFPSHATAAMAIV
jgi:hypothetical protein